jgi:hypothetical protein
MNDKNNLILLVHPMARSYATVKYGKIKHYDNDMTTTMTMTTMTMKTEDNEDGNND